jgi:CheY-like chemotaxis protein
VGKTGHKVLVVDDERTIADTLTLIFSKSGYDTRAAYSAEQALEIVAQWPPDLAIIDVVLPGMNGIDLAIVLRAECPICRLLLFSGQAITTDLLADAATKGHTFEILAKPVHPTVMLDTALQRLTAAKAKDTRETAASHGLSGAEVDEPPIA